MKHISYREACEVANNCDKSLRAMDFGCGSLVQIVHEEGSMFTWKYAFLREWLDWVFVFTEHHGTHVYHRCDLYSWGEYRVQEDKKLEGTGYEDECEFCGRKMLVENLRYDILPNAENINDRQSFCDDCWDVQTSRHPELFSWLNKGKASGFKEDWNFVWGKPDILHLKRACATIMSKDYVDTWLQTKSESFPDSPQKLIDEDDYDDIYLAIHNMGCKERIASGYTT